MIDWDSYVLSVTCSSCFIVEALLRHHADVGGLQPEEELRGRLGAALAVGLERERLEPSIIIISSSSSSIISSSSIMIYNSQVYYY